MTWISSTWPALPMRPSWRPPRSSSHSGLLLGFLLGLGGAFLLEALTPRSAGRRISRPPARSRSGRHSPPHRRQPHSAEARPAASRETSRAGSKRANARAGHGDSALLHRHRGLPDAAHQPDLVGWRATALKTLVVTSAAPGEGKTLTAANLAVTLAYDGLAGAAGRLRRPPAPVARPLPGAPRARAHGAADPSQRQRCRSRSPSIRATGTIRSPVPTSSGPRRCGALAADLRRAADQRRPTCSAARGCGCCCRSCASSST